MKQILNAKQELQYVLEMHNDTYKIEAAEISISTTKFNEVVKANSDDYADCVEIIEWEGQRWHYYIDLSVNHDMHEYMKFMTMMDFDYENISDNRESSHCFYGYIWLRNKKDDSSRALLSRSFNKLHNIFSSCWTIETFEDILKSDTKCIFEIPQHLFTTDRS